MALFLASNSPRRKQILSEIGYVFETISIDFNEYFPKEVAPAKVSEYIVRQKINQVREVIKIEEGQLILVADTVVFLGDKALGKPTNKQEAKNMLVSLSGKNHYVSSAFGLISSSKEKIFEDSSEVFFRELTLPEIEFYIEKFEPTDKAGSYGIQEWIGIIGIEKIIGNYHTILGIPGQKLYQALTKQNIYPKGFM